MPPMCMKLSTHGVRPKATLSAVTSRRPRQPVRWIVQRAQKLMMMSAQQAPKRPKTEADAPTESTPGRKTMETMVPNQPERMYSRPTRQKPNTRSMLAPIWRARASRPRRLSDWAYGVGCMRGRRAFESAFDLPARWRPG